MSGAGGDRQNELTEVYPGLFLISTSGDAPCWVYYLMRDDPVSPNDKPDSLSDLWAASEQGQPGFAKYYGWFVFLPDVIPDADAKAFVRHGRSIMPALAQRDWHGIVWLLALFDLPVVAMVAQWSSPGRFAAVGDPSFNFGAFRLLVSDNAVVPITLDTSGQPAFVITALLSDAGLIQVSIAQQRQAPYLPPNGWRIEIGLDGPRNGSLCFNVALDIGPIAAQFGCCLQFGYCDAAGPATLPLPVFPPTSLAAGRRVAFNILLNPVWPQRAGCTALEFDFSGRIDLAYSNNARAIATPWLLTPNGESLGLLPYEGSSGLPYDTGSPGNGSSPVDAALPPGFAFCVAPAAAGSLGSIGSPGESAPLYLAPSGRFLLSNPAASPDPDQPCQMMPGLFVHEFINLRIGDSLVFETGQPAWAAGFSPAGSPASPTVWSSPVDSPDADQPATLTTLSTTAWLRVMAAGDGERAYFSQPSKSCYYATGGGEQFPVVIDARLGDAARSGPFPMILYGGLLSADPLAAAFEAAVLTPARHAALGQSPNGPIFLPPKQLALLAPRPHPAPAVAAALPPTALPPAHSATTVTPQGLLVELNAEGTWQNLLLASSSAKDGGDFVLAFEALDSPGIMDPKLSRLLTLDQMFIVMTDLSQVRCRFRNEIAVGGFVMRIDFTQAPVVLIFKFNNQQPLTALASSPSLWSGKDILVPDVAAAMATIGQAIATAQGGDPDDVFTNFNRIVSDPSWTGILALNVPIDGNAMPLDLQILLGGINGGLRAHHFGIEITRLQHGGSPGLAALGPSSLFGVIAYAAAPPGSPPQPIAGALDYEVERLRVEMGYSGIRRAGAGRTEMDR